ncbi:MAG TPA: sugar transferase [Anaerohalosphaeraceae bacterium]|nr:sugar transferase [Anaerohalosphaeraceae bacterium]HOM76583.1 sugar transferase [Anaerohalosphaeraceae bacterium]HPC64569.1 sugar transferase [Anaerohalosphaeraceae bacterium]HPO70495.1 sugar transferase [Anaerohalosphaeraceae bacterium]HRS71638.1 sugar transferase [Anaerohalosphaeraceae bacterium]
MNFLLLAIDAVLLYGMFLLAYLIRYGQNIPPASFAPFRDSRLFLVGIILAALVQAGVFRRRFRSYWQLFQKLFYGLLAGTVLDFVLMYLLRDRWMRFPSSILLLQFGLSLAVLFFVNGLLLRLKNRIQKRVVILGSSEFHDPFLKKSALVRLKHITAIEELMHIRDVDEVMICERLQDEKNLNLLIFLLLKLNVTVTFGPAVYAELIAGRIQQDNIVHLISTFLGRKSDGEEFMIRLLDIVGSLLLLVIFSPVFLAAACWVKLTSPGPVIYRQVRVGKDRQLFTIYKFRTMRNDSDKLYGYKPAVSGDQRFTPVGRFLRRTRFDELPQLFNVLKGQMSLVGPRPENVWRVNTHKALRGLRLAVKPGLTGLAQIRSYYDVSPGHKVKYDYLYIQRRSFMLNLYILLKTIPVVLTQKGV